MSRPRNRASSSEAADRLDRLARSWQPDVTSDVPLDADPLGPHGESPFAAGLASHAVGEEPPDDDAGMWPDAPWPVASGDGHPHAPSTLDRSLPPQWSTSPSLGSSSADEPGSWRERMSVGLDGRARRAAVALVAVVLGVVAVMWWTGRPVETTPIPDATTAVVGGQATVGTTAEVVVHVVGAVHSPGIVTLPVGARVGDAIDAAGGATRQRALSSVNLARVLVDGEQIVVGQAATTSAAGGKVSLSTADAAALEDLPGIGPALAARIVSWREVHGPFPSVDALDEVSGIGPSVLAQLRDLVVP